MVNVRCQERANFWLVAYKGFTRRDKKWTQQRILLGVDTVCVGLGSSDREGFEQKGLLLIVGVVKEAYRVFIDVNAIGEFLIVVTQRGVGGM